jgi:lipoprotein-anchoring transpeptidase ErfK/SrfK
MMKNYRFQTIALIIVPLLLLSGCEPASNNKTPANAPGAAPANTNTNSQPMKTNAAPPKAPLFTLPMLNAFLANEAFTQDLKKRVELTDEQIRQLKNLVEENRKQTGAQQQDNAASYARQYADERVRALIGEEKMQQLAALVNEYWTGSANRSAPSANAGAPVWNAIPSDTRVVVNAPAYRLDVFQNGQLLKSYKVGIGYPEFPLPVGQRQAKEIIFNPTWTPPDEPWVEGSNKVKIGEKIEAGDKLNPLGIAKIPIGLPSLIHGGKAPAVIGGFASHGCVGFTDNQLRDFMQTLAQASGTQLSGQEIAAFGKKRNETKSVKLNNPVPVELRYETIVVEDGNLHIYRDVYDMDTNTEENLRAVLAKYNVNLEDLSADERAKTLNALQEMSRDAKGKLDNATDKAQSKDKAGKPKNESGKVTRTVKGAKEIIIAIAALADKGYPAPVALNTGGARPATPAALPKPRR